MGNMKIIQTERPSDVVKNHRYINTTVVEYPF
jgi:hypothetical protein